MISKFDIFIKLLLASAALAAPSSLLEARLARRRERAHQSQPLKRVEGPDGTSIFYSDNWTGAVWEQGDGTFTSVTGTFTVPTPSGSSGSAAAIWVGIDGASASCNNAILQTGVDIGIDDDGEAWYDAWYEWWPAGPIYFDDFTINAGDVIQATVTAFSTTSGIAILENLTSNQVASQVIYSSYALYGQDAEWIVEDYTLSSTGSLVPFVDFGTVTFTDASASGPDGLFTPSGADPWITVENGVYLSSVSIDGSSVTITYE